jgi:hypothetical protein
MRLIVALPPLALGLSKGRCFWHHGFAKLSSTRGMERAWRHALSSPPLALSLSKASRHAPPHPIH